MSNVYRIRIKKGFANGTMRLSDNGSTRAAKSDFILWTINPDSDVASIDGITLKPSMQNSDIFLTPPHANGTNWSAEIKDNVTVGEVCNYEIAWTDKEGNRKMFDPIITIKPSRNIYLMGMTIIAYVLGIITAALANYLYFHFK